jgi:protease IV
VILAVFFFMAKFFTGFAVGLIAAALIGVLLIVAAVRLGSPKPTVAANSALVLRLEGDVPEQAPVDVPVPFLEGQQPMTMVEIWRLLQTAAADNRIKSLVIEPSGLTAGWAGLEELRADILAFKKSGKPVHAYLRGAGTHDYYVATAADDIYMAPEDELDVKGLRAELVYVKGTLDKLGVSMEFEHVGKYKDAPDQFTKTGPSPETLEVENQILDQYFGDIVRVIADGRKKSPEAVRALIDEGPFVGKSALDGGLVDGLIFEDEMYQKFGNPAKIGGRSYAQAQAGASQGKRIAVITEEGDITRGGSSDSISDSGITVAGSVKVMRDVEDDASIQGVILRINSPGGDGIASDDILHEAKKLSQKKPMVISMGDLAASGGYFIAMTGDPVVSYANTLTGSIGVFYGRVNLKGLYDKIGLTKTLLTRGKYAAIDSENGPLTDEQRAKLKKEIEGFYGGFVQRVADGRKRKYDDVEPLAQGRVWLGSQAKSNGLVDEIGGLDRAVELVKQKAKIGATEKVTLVTFPPKRSLFEMIMNRSGDSSEVESKIRGLFGKLPIRALAQGGVMRLMPFTIVVK